MTPWEAIRRVRVVRSFDARPLPPEAVERIVDAGRHAGSSKNQQRWDFIVVGDRDHLRELAEVGAYAGHLAGASVAVALVTPGARTAAASSSVMWDLGRAAQNMVLAAWELGIGSVPATVYDHALAARLLGLPADRRCDFLLSFGYPADPAALSAPSKKGGRKPLDAVTREGRW
ncbi:MAG: nitroreductase family protein [Chloroflexi bacterium]|nr:nitroreductase family protein [Chloroflexota bacterium]